MIAMPIMAILALVVTQFLISSSQGLATIRAMQLIESVLSRAMQEINSDIRQASSPSLTGCDALGTHYTTGTTTVCMTVPSLDAQGNAIPSQGDVLVYTYNAAAGTLTRIVDANASSWNPSFRMAGQTVIARDLSNVTFVVRNRASRWSITTTLTGTRTEQGRPYSQTLVSQARLRNTLTS